MDAIGGRRAASSVRGLRNISEARESGSSTQRCGSGASFLLFRPMLVPYNTSNHGLSRGSATFYTQHTALQVQIEANQQACRLGRHPHLQFALACSKKHDAQGRSSPGRPRSLNRCLPGAADACADDAATHAEQRRQFRPSILYGLRIRASERFRSPVARWSLRGRPPKAVRHCF